MRPFDVQDNGSLARLLAVAPFEIEEVLANRSKYYRVFRHRKPDGRHRLIYNPEAPLKLLQQKVRTHILDLVPLPGCVHGGVRGRSVVTNARPHVRKQIVFCVDVRDFYPSVRSSTIFTIFTALGFGSAAADVLTNITTWDDHIPQGVSTSTALANLAMTRVDVRIQILANKNGFAYTRYIDDLTLSGTNRLLTFRPLIQRIIKEEGFAINPNKVATMHSGMRQVVAGIVVNRKLNVAREDRHTIRQALRLLRSARSEMSVDQIRGKISWVSQVNPGLGAHLANRFRASF